VFITNHALAGAAIGLATRRPAAAFLTGVASHVAMDMVLHWGDDIGWDQFVRVAKVDGTVGLGVCAALLVAAPTGARRALVAGVAGACLIDMDKPGMHFAGRSPFPAVVDRFHGRIQNQRPVGLVVELATAAGLAAGLLGARRRRRRHPGRGLATVRTAVSPEVRTWQRSTPAARSTPAVSTTRSTA
jgi:hypothetical protein